MDVKTNKEIIKKVKEAEDEGSHRLWIVSYIILAVICIAVYFLLQFQVFGLLGTYRSLLQRLALAGLVIAIVFVITRTIEKIIAKKSQTKKITYNVIRLIRFLSVVIAAFIVITFLF